MAIPEEIALDAIFYCGKILVFCKLINKNVSEWFLLKICIEYTLSRSTDRCKYDSTLLNPLSTNPTEWSNTLKQFVGKLPTNCLSVFDHFMKLALKGLTLWLEVTFQNLITSSWTVTFSTYEGVCLGGKFVYLVV